MIDAQKIRDIAQQPEPRYSFGRDEESDMFWFAHGDKLVWLTAIECPIDSKRERVLTEALEIVCDYLNGNTDALQPADCIKCGGTGKIDYPEIDCYFATCDRCNGDGHEPRPDCVEYAPPRPAPPDLLPVGTLVILDEHTANPGKLCRITKHRPELNFYELDGGPFLRPYNCTPYIPPLLQRGNTCAETTGDWRIRDGKVEAEVRIAERRDDCGLPLSWHDCYWPLAECTGLAVDPHMEAK